MLGNSMIPHTIDELETLMVQSQLLSRAEIAGARNEIAWSEDPQELLQVLQSRQLLTPFQVGRLQKGEVNGLVIGGCKLLYRNAAGSFARVYRAVTVGDGRTIGVKLLRERYSNDPDTIQLFHREGDIGKRLRHPNIVPIYETGTDGNHHYITMEFIEGGNLRDFLNIRRQLAVEEACKFVLHMARGLDYAASQGITHRDLKMTNVLMSTSGVAKLIDFGLGADDRFLNRPGAPELAQALEYSTLEKGTNAKRNDPRSDLFFLGTIFYELLTGQPPYERTRDREERKRFGRYRDIPPISALLPSIDWRVAAIVDQLLQISPEMRFQTAAEVVSRLENVLNELGHPEPLNPGARQAETTATKTILCVEHRPKRQDVLREYFSKHGFRVLLLSDSARAITRLKNSTPDCLILFGDAIGAEVVDRFKEAMSAIDRKQVCIVAVLAADQEHLQTELTSSDPRAQVLLQPVRLRDLRQSIESVLK